MIDPSSKFIECNITLECYLSSDESLSLHMNYDYSNLCFTAIYSAYFFVLNCIGIATASHQTHQFIHYGT